jgi:K+-sensing histidine kinase KdpD
LAIPLRAQDTIIGVLELVNKRKGTFDQSDQMLAETLASSAAIAVQNARLLNQARERSAELQVRNEELDAFAHTVAHDLKTPLSLVMGFADMLRESIPQLEEAEISDYLNQIVEHSSRMSQIIEALLLLAGAHGTQGVTPEPVAMGEIIAEALRRLEVVLEQNKAELSLPDDWPLVTGYGPWLEEVWANYLLNGVKYGGKPPQLVLGWEPENKTHIRFWIQDNGSGIKLEKGTLFTPLSRSNNGPRNGHGLGLSIVKRIVTRLNGEVGADSEPGIGSRFWFTLPLATDEEFDTE